jgi:hypothetical protein
MSDRVTSEDHSLGSIMRTTSKRLSIATTSPHRAGKWLISLDTGTAGGVGQSTIESLRISRTIEPETPATICGLAGGDVQEQHMITRARK